MLEQFDFPSDSPCGLESLWLELTQKCNLTCNHCYADSHPGRELLGEMAVDDWLRVIDDAADLGCAYVQFIGGEPLLHPGIEKFARRANDRGMAVEVLTNGTVLSARLLNWMSALKVDVSTSIYASCPSPHDAVTGKVGSWQRTIMNIDRMLDQGLRVRAGVIYRDWTGERVDDTIAFLQRKGVAVGTDRVRGIGRGGPPSSVETYLGELCGACGEERICVTNSGSAYPCIMARRTPLGNVRSDGLQAILAGEALAAFRKDLAALPNRGRACTPDCWPHGGCAPHDVCNPHKQAATSAEGNCTPDCWPHGGCAPHDLCNPHKAAAETSSRATAAH